MSRVRDSFVRGLLGPIVPLLDDPSVSEILINNHREIYVEREGLLEQVELHFEDASALEAALRSIAQSLGRPFSRRHPVLEGRLFGASRIEAVHPPIAQGEPCVAIRRHQAELLSLERLLELGALTEPQLERLAEAIEARENILVSGGTGSGKTSLLNCLASLISPAERVVTLEDARELALQQPHVVSLETRPADERGDGALSMTHLFRATLRLRPDRIVIGELRGGEAFDLLQAMNSGHGGCLSTLHASTPLDALRRIEGMVLAADVPLSVATLRSQLASGVDLVVQVQRRPDGTRCVSEIARVLSLDESGAYRVETLVGRSASTPETSA